MRCFDRHHYRSLPIIAVLCVLWTTPTQGQPTSKPDDQEQTIKSLLAEVRRLRQSVEAAALNSHRSHIVIERLRTNGEHVLRLSRALTELRETMDKTLSTIPRMTEQLKVMEATFDAEVDVVKRARLEFEIKETKRAVERYKSGLERMKEQEQQLSTQFREGQARQTELEDRLDKVEAEIESEIRRQREERSDSNRRQP